MSIMLRCGKCSYLADLFHTRWCKTQGRLIEICPSCGEDEKIDCLDNGRGLYPSTLPDTNEATKQLTAELPRRWLATHKTGGMREVTGHLRKLTESLRSLRLGKKSKDKPDAKAT